MKMQIPKKLFAFIITVMMFSVMPALVNAQRKCPDGSCPKGYICSSGYCVKSGGWGTPICPRCGYWKTTVTNNPGAQSIAIYFSLEQVEKFSVKIFDMSGRLVKTVADKIIEPGEHIVQWDATGVNAGIYIVQFNDGTYRETKKISVIK